MESITYKREDFYVTKFVTRCPYKRRFFIGSHDCFFCRYCKGRTADTVRCSFNEVHKPAKQPADKRFFSMDVMVGGEFRRTIRVEATGLKVVNGSLHRSLTTDDIERAVEKHCPIVFAHEKWNVEFNR